MSVFVQFYAILAIRSGIETIAQTDIITHRLPRDNQRRQRTTNATEINKQS